VRALKQIPGAKVLFGGELLDPSTHSIPACYGSFQPTAIQVRRRIQRCIVVNVKRNALL
jgi:hypothetical protein